MRQPRLIHSVVLTAIVALLVRTAPPGRAQTHTLPNPYREVSNWAKLPPGAKWAGVISVDPASNGDMWVFHRSDPPILRFDRSGKVVASFGDGMFVQAHGMTIDREGNVWVTDAQSKDGRGNQVLKLSPQGKVLLTLGKPGASGGPGSDVFNGPCDVAVAANGDIFVADGHFAKVAEHRIMKFSKDGKFIKAWGKRGPGPGEFDTPHALAIDSRGRIFVADRSNNRLQVFDQDGLFLDEWKQFGRPSGVFIDKNDMIYVADSQSNSKQNPGFTRGIRIGSARDGKVPVFIPALGPEEKPTSTTEGIVVDAAGNLYAGETGSKNLRKYVKK